MSMSVHVFQIKQNPHLQLFFLLGAVYRFSDIGLINKTTSKKYDFPTIKSKIQ